jgi:TonB family protein
MVLAGAWLVIASPALAKDKNKSGPAKDVPEKEVELKPTPIGSPGSWIPADGYPPAARASAEEGRVGFTLEVDDTGRVSECKVTVTSGSPLLDDTTCNFMTANGRFTPPRDARNKPVASKWSSAMLWKLQPATPPPPAAAPTPAPVSPKGK